MKQDAISDVFKVRADHWLSIVGMTDEAVATRIRGDRIDILVDLAGHTANGRPLVFARKPAPVQVNWLGYPNTTGLKTMDYRLTDAVANPPGDADRLHTEELIRLPHGFLCYQTDDPNPTVSPPPCLERGYVTFGSFNHLPKLNPEVIRVWSGILKSLPESRLVLKSGPLADASTRALYLKKFADHGIPADRVDLIGRRPSRMEHLQTYSQIDICLDPFPYNGTTTTFEALWMGVPVICLRGDRHAGRVGASIMHHLGLPEHIAETEEEYIDLAKKLAGDTDRLDALRNDLRTRLHESVLMNIPLFTEALEQAYRQMWTAWCDKRA
jgi:protein O-GlcNAc transferase